MAARVARFNFDLDLAKEPQAAVSPAPAPPPIPTIPEEVAMQMVQQAREEAYAQGLAAGEANAEAMAAQTLAVAAGTLATRTVEMAAALDDATADIRRQGVELAASVGRKLALHLLARYPTVELEALIGECMQNLAGVPHLVIRCHPELADCIRDIATAHMQTSGFAGRLVVMGDPEIRLGDGRLEWVDGGLVRDIAAIAGDIDRTISAYLAGRHRPGSQEESHA
jgi:flagellar assembly protein FliH